MSSTNQTAVYPISKLTWLKILDRLVTPSFNSVKWSRQQKRYRILGEAKASWKEEDQLFNRTWEIMEVSPDGISVKSIDECSVGLRINLLVNLDGLPIPLYGTVMHCTQTIGGFKIGVRLEFDAIR